MRTTDRTLKEFDSKPRKYEEFYFFGLHVKGTIGTVMKISQPHYARNLLPSQHDCTFESFRRDRALFTWVTHTRPDVACIANRAAHTTEKTLGKDRIRELNQGVTMIKASPNQGLTYPTMSMDGLHIRTYADASFANNDDLTSQLGYVTLLRNWKGECHLIDYASRKARRVVRSVMAAEAYALLDAFDAAYALSCDLSTILSMRLPLHMLTDSKQVFDAVIRGRRTTEKRLSIELACARQGYQKSEIERVCLVRGIDNPADAMTKAKPNTALRDILLSNFDGTVPVEWVARNDADNLRSLDENRQC